MTVHPGLKNNAAASGCHITELFTPKKAHLDFLSAAEIRLAPGAASSVMGWPGQEALLFNLRGPVVARLDGVVYKMAHYDVLYVPVGAALELTNNGDEEVFINLYRAFGDEVHPPFHAEWEKFRKDPARIRELHRKEVFIMFDVGEKANRFIAGYTFYQDHTRAWPPHNHTDQEEVYSFIEGRGAMEVYEEDENKTFVVGVETGDHITIPILNYHPVFSHDEPLAFIWCIAGERYWVGDKNQDFMKGEGEAITT